MHPGAGSAGCCLQTQYAWKAFRRRMEKSGDTRKHPELSEMRREEKKREEKAEGRVSAETDTFSHGS